MTYILILSLFILTFSLIYDIVEHIKLKNKWRKYTGVYVVATYVRDHKTNLKTQEMLFYSELEKNSTRATINLDIAIKFSNQYDALKAIRKCTFDEMFVVKL